MSYWDSKLGKIVSFPSVPIEGYQGWIWADCGCSGGLQWGGDSPVECGSCDGTGRLARHLKSNVLAICPGGPLKGSYKME